MRVTIELWSRVEKGAATPYWTAGARLGGTDIVFHNYAAGVVPPGKPFPFTTMVKIAREARDALAKIEEFERIYEMTEIGPDFAVYEVSKTRGL